MGINFSKFLTLPILAQAYLRAGELDASLTTATRALQVQRDTRTAWKGPTLLETLGRIYSHPDRWDPAAAQERFQEALRAADEMGDRVAIPWPAFSWISHTSPSEWA
jgi:hypothetical protein